MRTSKPTAGNKFYITTGRGGYSLCIQGSPTDAACNVLSNCVGYACGRFNEIIGSMKYPALNCNAENFIERAQALGLQISQTPSLGAIAVWQKGTLASGDGAGHVEVVERIDSDTQIYTSASNYAGTAFYNSVRSKVNGSWALPSGWGRYSFRGFIVNPAVAEAPASVEPFPGVSDEVLAARVWAGEFGTGDARRAALGNRYDAVQALVDKGVGKPSPPAEPTPAEPFPGVSDEQLAARVWAGEFGVGEARKTALGIRYSAVQALVDKGVGKPGAPSIGVGSSVRLNNGARFYDGTAPYSFVYDRTHTISELHGDRAVIVYSGVTVGAVRISDLSPA